MHWVWFASVDSVSTECSLLSGVLNVRVLHVIKFVICFLTQTVYEYQFQNPCFPSLTIVIKDTILYNIAFSRYYFRAFYTYSLSHCNIYNLGFLSFLTLMTQSFPGIVLNFKILSVSYIPYFQRLFLLPILTNCVLCASHTFDMVSCVRSLSRNHNFKCNDLGLAFYTHTVRLFDFCCHPFREGRFATLTYLCGLLHMIAF